MKLKHIALAAMLAATGVANAAIDDGAGGNGELFFSIWDDNGSYTRDLNLTIDAFQAEIAAVGDINLSFVNDATFTSYLAGVADTSLLKWNILATDQSGARRIIQTYGQSVDLTSPDYFVQNDNTRTNALNAGLFALQVNEAAAGADSVAVGSSSGAWAGNPDTFGQNIATFNPFDNSGTIANSSYASGLNLTRVDAKATGIAGSLYTQYLDSDNAVRAYFDGNALNIAAVTAVPEPESYAMLLAGLGLMGAIARRRSSNKA